MEVTAKDAYNLAFFSYSATIMLVILGSVRRSRQASSGLRAESIPPNRSLDAV
jgi:hypothetical protein